MALIKIIDLSKIASVMLLIVFFTYSCTSERATKMRGFSLVPAVESGIAFSNFISENDSINYFTYPYIFMGGGVAVGDINNDGLTDIYFTSNMGENKLFLNKGDLKFEDISVSAKVSGDDRWYTGAVMVDVNGDELIDIYVCVSGKWKTTKNQLFLNKGNNTFEESAGTFGLADSGNSTQASFLDYDNDGDLDVYVANYPPLPFDAPYFQYSQNKNNPKLETSDHLYRNDGESYVDVTKESGVLNFGLTLSATSADINNDGWQDIYISNDFASQDFVYLNLKNGTFLEVADKVMGHTSFYGMGADIADITGNGYLDVFQVDMTPSDHYRSRTNMSSMNIEGFEQMKDLGIQTQYMENSFQLNQGINSNGLPLFSDVSRISNTSLTDWSWSPLIFDMDNDGLKDIHITNGTRKEINNKDFFNDLKKKRKLDKSDNSYLQESEKIPSQAISNVTYRQVGELSFEDMSEKWNMNQISFSNGSAYADFDNDGDLDLVINNIDQEAFLYENNSCDNNWLRVDLKGSRNNISALGSRIEVFVSGGNKIVELTSSRGFQSGSEVIAHFGLGQEANVDSVIVHWANNKISTIISPPINNILQVSIAESTPKNNEVKLSQYFNLVSNESLNKVSHVENTVIDFQYELLLPHAMSMFGPALAVGDIDNDGLDDFYLGGAKDQNAFIMMKNGSGDEFEAESNLHLASNAFSEDVDAHFFDADGDGDLDLYVACGGNERLANHEFYSDKFYENIKGQLISKTEGLPHLMSSASKVKSADIDNDGDLDLLVSARHVPHQYGKSASCNLLLNESTKDQIKFTDVTNDRASELINVGMVTDFVWVDHDNDSDLDLVVVGEWMPILFFDNNDGYFVKNSDLSIENIGWWSSINYADINKDGMPDFVVGNLGNNYKYKVNDNAEFGLHVSDFDQNGKRDIVLSYLQDDVILPIRGKQCTSEQMPSLGNKYETYHDFAKADLTEIYGKKALDAASIITKVNTFSSQLLLSNEKGTYNEKDLPLQAQFSSINSSLLEDFTADGNIDILVAGNLYASEAETKRNDASYGLLLKGNGTGDFISVPLSESGFTAQGDVKVIKKIEFNGKDHVLVARNNDHPLLFQINNSKKFNDEIF